jgi:hypothetical protein
MSEDSKYRAFHFAKEVARAKLSDFTAALRQVHESRGEAIRRTDEQAQMASEQRQDQGES